MQLGIFAKTFSGTQPALVLRQAREAGYSQVQYNLACSGLESMPGDIAAPIAGEILLASRAEGVALAAVSGTYNMIHPDRAVRTAGHARLATLAAACRAMGTDLITVCTGTRDPLDQWKAHPDNDSAAAWSDLLEAMEVAIEIAELHNVYLGIEPELANVVNSAGKARTLIDTLKSDRLRIVLDPANLMEVGTPEARRNVVAEAVDVLADRIVMGHAKDRYADGRFATAGLGVLDFSHYLNQLQAIGFRGALITHGLAAHEAAGVATFLRGTCDALGIILDTPLG